MLSQQQETPARLHPYAFFSGKLSPAENNYDIGNRELLAIKLALEEWRHCLEGAKHPFTVLTDHKNLKYLHEEKWLNPHQARWALFFTRFNFSISYRPGSKNVKADALFCPHTPEEICDDPEPLIPKEMVVSPIQWSSNSVPSSNPPLTSRQAAQQVCNMWPEHSAFLSFTPLWALATRGPMVLSCC